MKQSSIQGSFDVVKVVIILPERLVYEMKFCNIIVLNDSHFIIENIRLETKSFRISQHKSIVKYDRTQFPTYLLVPTILLVSNLIEWKGHFIQQFTMSSFHKQRIKFLVIIMLFPAQQFFNCCMKSYYFTSSSLKLGKRIILYELPFILTCFLSQGLVFQHSMSHVKYDQKYEVLSIQIDV